MSSLPTHYRTLEIPVDGIYLDYYLKKHHIDERTIVTLFAQACHKALLGYEDDELDHVLMLSISPAHYLLLQEWDDQALASEKNTHEHALEAAQHVIALACNAK